MPEIDIIIYHGGPLKNANANKGLPFEGPGIKTYYTQIDRRLKTLDELKMMVMEELCKNPAMHNIHITYRMPNEILKHRINYKYMAIEADKHVKIMFDKLERIPEVTNIELYIQLEPRAEVGIEEEIQQTQTSLQVTVPYAQYQYFRHVEHADVHAGNDDDEDEDENDDENDDDYDDEDEDEDEDDDYVDENIAINGEDLAIEMRLKTGLNKGTLGTLRGTLMTMRHWTVVNLMHTMFLVSKTLQTQSLYDILKKLCEDHTTPIKHLRSMIESKYEGQKPSYYKVWDAKQKAIEKMFGNWEESYQRLQKLLMAYIDQDPTTQH
ncbi:glutamic acid-rich protein-like [Quercus lobata]|uniref:glutamic acid-rich protein-like n=1 Tax=Quercus lobata TaxID=97700 RepID=UPI0012489A08|nr:glutamic acid-rich protein-like [Quercus lobata]